MKKATARSGRSARTVEAARARKTARVTKARTRVAARVARSTVAAALGAGVLLHGGHVAPGWAGPAGSVVLVASVDEPGDDGAATADSGADPSGEDSSSESESDAESDSESDSGSDTDSGSDSDAGGAAQDAPEDDGTDDGADDDVTGEDTTATTEDDDPATGAPPVPSSGSSSSASPAPRPAVPAAPTAVTEPARGAAGASTATATRAAVETAVRDATTATTAATKRAQEALRTAVPATAVPAAPAQQVTGSVLGRLVMALVGLAPTSSSSSSSQGLPAPVAPASALLLAQWAFFRRSENPLFNRSPEITSPGGLGPTTGSVVATDPDGDRLTYEVSRQPEHGTVKLDRSTGAYVYTPNPGYTGADSFDVTVRDNDPRARGLGAFTDLVRQALSARHPALAQRLFGAHTDTVTISVVAPTSTATPAPNPVSGVTSGDLGIVAAPGETLAFDVVGPPRSGVLVLDPRTGRYTYTATAAARQEAARTGARPVETVVIRVIRSAAPVGAVTFAAPAEQVEYYALTFTIAPAPAATPTVGSAVAVGPAVQSAHLNRDGSLLFVTSSDGLSVVDTKTGDVRVVLAGTAGTAGPVPAAVMRTASTGSFFDSPRVSPDGGRMVVVEYLEGGGSKVIVIDLDTGDVVARIPTTTGPGVTFDPTGTHLILTETGVTSVHQASDGAPVSRFTHDPASGWAQISDDGRWLYTRSWQDTSVVLFDTTTGRSRTIDVGSEPIVEFAPDGRRIVVTGYGARSATVIDGATGADVVVPLSAGAGKVAFGPDGSRIYVVLSADERVTVLDAATGDAVGGFAVGSDPAVVQFSPDGSRGYVLNYEDGTATVFDTRSHAVLATLDIAGQWPGLRFSTTGDRAYAGTYLGPVTIIDTATDEVVDVVPGTTSTNLTLSPDGRSAYSTGEGTIVVIDTATDTWRTHVVDSYASRPLFSADGTRAYVTSGSGLTIIDRTDDSVSTTLTDATWYQLVDASPDGLFVVALTGDTDGASGVVFVRVADDVVTALDVRDAQEVRFSPDGEHAYVVSSNGTVTVVSFVDDEPAVASDPAEVLEAV